MHLSCFSDPDYFNEILAAIRIGVMPEFYIHFYRIRILRAKAWRWYIVKKIGLCRGAVCSYLRYGQHKPLQTVLYTVKDAVADKKDFSFLHEVIERSKKEKRNNSSDFFIMQACKPITFKSYKLKQGAIRLFYVRI